MHYKGDNAAEWILKAKERENFLLSHKKNYSLKVNKADILKALNEVVRLEHWKLHFRWNSATFDFLSRYFKVMDASCFCCIFSLNTAGIIIGVYEIVQYTLLFFFALHFFKGKCVITVCIPRHYRIIWHVMAPNIPQGVETDFFFCENFHTLNR